MQRASQSARRSALRASQKSVAVHKSPAPRPGLSPAATALYRLLYPLFANILGILLSSSILKVIGFIQRRILLSVILSTHPSHQTLFLSSRSFNRHVFSI
jgi:hypothetical protein